MKQNHAFIAIVAGCISAMLSLAFLSGSAVGVFFLVYLVPLPILMVGLALGPLAALVAAGAGTALSFSIGIWGAAMFAALHAIPAWLVSRLATTKIDPELARDGRDVEEELPGTEADAPLLPERPRNYNTPGAQQAESSPDLGWYPAGSILVWLAMLAGVYMVASSVIADAGLEKGVSDYLTGLFDMIAPNQDALVRLGAIEMLGKFFPGLVGAFWVLMLGANSIFAQGLLAKGKKNLRPSPRMRELTLPEWPSWALVGSAALALIGTGEIGYLGRNLFVVFTVPYFFLGLSVVHVLASSLRFPAMLLAMVYLVTLATGWFALVIGGIGILEQWVGLRRRIVKAA